MGETATMMLRPYTVADFTDARGEIGPMLLGDLGADVIRIEPPEGTAARRCAPLTQDGSLSLQFLAFNRNKRSIIVQPDERELLEALIAQADFLFESWPDGLLEAYGLDIEAVRDINAKIVHVRLSPYGSDVPRARQVANDLSLAAMGGPVSLQGSPDRAPLRLSVPQVWRHAGAESAAAAMLAHHRRLKTGKAQFVDLSAQCAMTWTMLNAMDAYAIQGTDFERSDGGLQAGGVRIDTLYEAADGYVVAAPVGSLMRGCMPRMIAEGLADAALATVDWEEYDQNVRDPNAPSFNVRDATDLCRRFFKRHTKEELFRFGLGNDASIAPVNTLAELLSLDHLSVREYWREIVVREGSGDDRVVVRGAGAWAKPSVGALAMRRGAPQLGEHRQEILDELAASVSGKPEAARLTATALPGRVDALSSGRSPSSSDSGKVPAPGATTETEGTLPFAGIKVVDFAWVGVGPISTKYLADHGATVIRVESETRPDVLRGGVPFKDGVPGINRSQFFGDFNTSKLSVSLNLKHPEAIDIAGQLVAWADVMVESFAPGAIERMGLAYADVRKLNPRIIMLSTCLMGQTGPARSLAGYGYHTAAIAGFHALTGWPDRSPSGPWVAYTDTVAPRFVSTILAAALDHRARTGEGGHIDLAQLETALHFLGPELLNLQVNGHPATRFGNRSSQAAPQGCYPCAGDDRWVAIAVDTDAQWRLLCGVIGRDDLADETALSATAGRQADHDRIDEAIAAWTRTRQPRAVMATLTQAGVPTGVVQRSSDLLNDEQYQHRGFYRYFEHPEMGRIPYAGHQYKVAGYDNGPRAAAPLLGEHSFEVLSDVLGLSDEAIGAAYASGAVS